MFLLSGLQIALTRKRQAFSEKVFKKVKKEIQMTRISMLFSPTLEFKWFQVSFHESKTNISQMFDHTHMGVFHFWSTCSDAYSGARRGSNDSVVFQFITLYDHLVFMVHWPSHKANKFVLNVLDRVEIYSGKSLFLGDS